MGMQGEEEQLFLFQDGYASQKIKNLNIALDKIYDKFGNNAILPGSILEKGDKN